MVVRKDPSLFRTIEITAINDHYLSKNELTVKVLDRGTAWLDSGTIQDLHAAASYIQVIEERQGSKVSCLEEIAWRNGWISDSDVETLGKEFGSNPYGTYLLGLIK